MNIPIVYRLLAAIALLLTPVIVMAQQKTIHGLVRDADGRPIERCMVRPSNLMVVTHTNAQGWYSLTYDAGDKVSALLFQCMGYEAKQVDIHGDALNVQLQRKVTELNDVVVSTGKDGKLRRGVLGKKKLKPFGMFSGDIGTEWAIFLDADSAKHGVLDKIYVYILNDALTTSRFRVHVYDIDTSYLPGHDLLDSPVIAHANVGDEWVAIDVSRMQVPVGGGVFISVEWIAGYGNDLRRVVSKTYSAQGEINGMILAGTEGYYKQWSLAYERNLLTNFPWKYQVLAGSFKKNIVNPMIYATYHYIR